MQKFLSEESKRAWVAKVKASKAAKKRKAENEPIPTWEIVELSQDDPRISNEQEDEGPGWRLKTILALQDQRESYTRQLAELDVAIKTVKALA